jgi:hypothetical protein
VRPEEFKKQNGTADTDSLDLKYITLKAQAPEKYEC